MDATNFAALAEPNRLQIVELLRSGPRAVGDVADVLDLRQPQASKHLAVLRQTGLVVVDVQGRRRIHALRAEPFQEIDAWVASFEHLWARRLDRLGAHLANHHPPTGRPTT